MLTKGMEPRKAWTSRQWLGYYRQNADAKDAIPWEAGAELTDDERQAIAASVQGFQLGESSEGRHLYQCAEAWGSRNDDSDYAPCIGLFIAEEQRHARDLGRFMDLNGIPRIRKALSDTAFRSLRRVAGLEVSIEVLVTAEVIAQVYYAALREATSSQVLRALCDRILRDEEEHVRFQSERLALVAKDYGYLRLALRRAGQRGLMMATLFIVWAAHRRAYRAGGYTFGRFAWETWGVLDRALMRMDPRAYDWAEEPRLAAPTNFQSPQTP